MSLPKLFRTAAFLGLACGFVSAMPAAGQQKKVNCSKPPEFIPSSKEAQQQNEATARDKHLKSPVDGTVAIEISDSGDVVDAKPARPSSGDVADYLVSVAKLMKFKPRPGCETFKITVSFHIGK